MLTDSEDNNQENPIIVLFDDGCPLCTAEINHYRKLVVHHPVDWVGINENIQMVEDLGYTREEVLKRLHVIKSDGVVVTGAIAFVSLWRALKFYRVLGFVVRKLGLVPILEFFYKRFAEKSYQKRLCSINKPPA